MSLGIIGGTGLGTLPGLVWEPQPVNTRWGRAELLRTTWHGREVWLLPRHGVAHSKPPHRINYRANIAALRTVGVQAVLASSAVGTLSDAHAPGSLALISDFVDHTTGRASTFFDDQVVHLDSSMPFCPALRAQLATAAGALGLTLAPAVVYACTSGPRFETATEIRALRAVGAQVVGMTCVPEVVLAREAEICYASLAIATNWAAGVDDHTLTHAEVAEMMATRLTDVQRLFDYVVATGPAAECNCRHALAGYANASDLRAVVAGVAD